MSKNLPKAAAAALAMSIPAALPAQADPALGFGLSFLLGGSSSASSNQTGLALRVFSDDSEDDFVGSLGLNYQFGTGTFSPTAGLAYLGSNTFVGLDMGFGLDGSGLNFGLSGGLANTDAGAVAGGGAGGGGGGGDDSGGGGAGDGNDVVLDLRG